MIFLDLEELLHVAARTLDAKPEIRDSGLLESALARPQVSADDQAYDLVIDVATGRLDDAAAIASVLAQSTECR